MGSQRRDQNLLDIGAESLAIDRPVDHPGCHDPVMAQRGDERHASAFRSDQWRSCLDPVSERCLSNQALAPHRPAAQRGHVGLGPGFINEHKPL